MKSKYGTVNRTSTSVNVLGVTLLLLPSVLYLASPANPSPQLLHDHGGTTQQWGHRTLLQVEEEEELIPNDWEFIVGYALGCFSAVVYFFALPPQIIKNVSTGGLPLIRPPLGVSKVS